MSLVVENCLLPECQPGVLVSSEAPSDLVPPTGYYE